MNELERELLVDAVLAGLRFADLSELEYMGPISKIVILGEGGGTPIGVALTSGQHRETISVQLFTNTQGRTMISEQVDSLSDAKALIDELEQACTALNMQVTKLKQENLNARGYLELMAKMLKEQEEVEQ